MAPYKIEEVKKALEMGAVGTIIFSKEMDKELVRGLKERAKSIGSAIEVVSTDTDEGVQFKNLSGIGAILRFKID